MIFFLAQIGSVIYHPDQNFEGVLTVWSEFWNSACGIRYGHICVAATLWSHMMKKCDLHQLGWFIYHSDQIFKGILNLATKIWNSICGSCYSYLYPIASHITGKFDRSQSGWFICHQDCISKEILDPKSEIWNYISGTYQGYICVLVTWWKSLTTINQGDLYIIWTRFSRRFQIQSQKHQIQLVTLTFGILVLNICFYGSIILDTGIQPLKFYGRHTEDICIHIN